MKKILCILAALLMLAGCAALAESDETAEPFNIRGVNWQMCPDEVDAIETAVLKETEFSENTHFTCYTAENVPIGDYTATLYYLFNDRSLFAAMYDIPDDVAYDVLLAELAAAYGEYSVLPEGAVEDWMESMTGYRTPIDRDEYYWSAPDGTGIMLIHYNEKTAVIFQSPNEIPAKASTPWTILLYLCGTDLESDLSCATKNMNAILESTDSDDIRFIIETGGTKEWQNGISSERICRFIRTGETFSLVESLYDANMGSGTTLQDFISWGVRNYPADHMGLIIWDHGSSSIGGVCFDDLHDRDSMKIPEISAALYNSSGLLPGGFEFIGYDACLMSSLECAYAMAPYAKYLYASEEVEPGSGWDYTSLLNWLAENPQADGLELGVVQTDTYTAFQADTPAETFCVVDLSKIGAVVEAFDAAAAEMDASENDTEIIRGIMRTDTFGPNSNFTGFINMIDIRDMMDRISEYVPSAPAVMSAIDDAMAYIRNGDQHYTAGGLSIYYPLRMRGTQEIPLFEDICPSANYLSFVSRVGKDAKITGDTVYAYGTWTTVPDSNAFNAVAMGFDDDGIYHCKLDSDSMDNLSMASCLLYQVTSDGTEVFFGEDDNVEISYSTNTITDAFDGTWTSMNGNIVPLEMVSKNGKISVYTVPIMFYGKEMNLRLIYNWETKEYSLDGVCSDVEVGTGAASRLYDLNEGDTFQICYYCKNGDNLGTVTSDEITVDDNLEIKFQTLPTGTYRYRIVLYDLSGNDSFLSNLYYEMHDDGSVTIPVSLNEDVNMNYVDPDAQ